MADELKFIKIFLAVCGGLVAFIGGYLAGADPPNMPIGIAVAIIGGILALMFGVYLQDLKMIGYLLLPIGGLIAFSGGWACGSLATSPLIAIGVVVAVAGGLLCAVAGYVISLATGE